MAERPIYTLCQAMPICRPSARREMRPPSLIDWSCWTFRRCTTAFAVGFLLVVLPAALLPDRVTVPANPGFLDNIFGNRWVIFGVRLLLVAAAILLLATAAYVVRSIIHRFQQGEWLQRVGWFEPQLNAQLDEQVAELVATAEVLEQRLEEAAVREERLQSAIEQTTTEADRWRAAARRAQERLREHRESDDGRRRGLGGSQTGLTGTPDEGNP